MSHQLLVFAWCLQTSQPHWYLLQRLVKALNHLGLCFFRNRTRKVVVSPFSRPFYTTSSFRSICGPAGQVCFGKPSGLCPCSSHTSSDGASRATRVTRSPQRRRRREMGPPCEKSGLIFHLLKNMLHFHMKYRRKKGETNTQQLMLHVLVLKGIYHYWKYLVISYILK